MKQLVSIFLCAAILLCLSSCANEKLPESFGAGSSAVESLVSEISAPEPEPDAASGLPKLTYVAPEPFLPAAHTVKEVNRYLLECEKEYQVEFVPLPYNGYDTALAEYLAAGKPADLISVSSLPEVREQLLDLTDYLDSEDGATLKDLYSDFGWGQVAFAGHVYTVPSNLYYDAPACYLVNRTLMEQMELTEADLQKPLWELHDLLVRVRDENPQEDFFPVMLGHGNEIFETNQVYKPFSGFSVDRETREAAYIFDRPEVSELMRTLHQYTREGLVGIGPSNTEYSNERPTIFLENMFLMYCSNGVTTYDYPHIYRSPDVFAEVDEEYLEITWQDPTIYCDRRPDGTGVAADSQYQGQALDFLTLAMTDRKLTDFLQHGIEGKEYFLTEDGKVNPIEYEGEFAYMEYRSLLYGNRRLATPTIYEFADKQERVERVFASGVVSDLIDEPAFTLTMEQIWELSDPLKEPLSVLDPDDPRSFDEIISEARAQIDAAGGQEILRQITPLKARNDL